MKILIGKKAEALLVENTALKREVDSLRSKNASLKQNVDSLKGEVDSLRSENSEPRHKINALQSDNAALRRRRDSLVSDNAELGRRIQSLEEALQPLTAIGLIPSTIRTLLMHIAPVLKGQLDQASCHSSSGGDAAMLTSG